MSVHTCNMVIYAVLIPVGGLLSDRIGRIELIVGPAAVLGLLAWPLGMLLSNPDSVIMAFEGQVIKKEDDLFITSIMNQMPSLDDWLPTFSPFAVLSAYFVS